MARDLSDPFAEIRALKERVRILETATPLQDSSITRGGLRIASDEGLKVEGSAVVSGTLNVTGVENVTGTLNVDGGLNVDGPWTLDGPGDITGSVDITGLLTLLSSLLVTSGGKITVGNGGNQIVIDGAAGSITVPGSNPIKLHQATGLARIDLGSTARIWSGGDGVTIAHTASGGFINVYSGGTDLSGGVSGNVRITDLPNRTGTGLTAGSVGADTDGTLWRAA